ncbi:HD domain-containing protein [Dyadobacter psychrotolerans]|uniref:HD domain-containing protein n=1 Tax=Dyadobacter psychrotolerans TaxID=2541721 RepID=A0A4R5DVP8_9BACT|nr:HD domain-containing protein [Dyadobacter psychrotolerans]TDE15315.1 HD domain-containing protein [Dyadobacter psychrotolerans]
MQLNRQQRAVLDFMKECHADQKRKYDHAPYWTHPYAVAALASAYIKDEGVIEIAFCHDVLEDTTCDQHQLSAELKRIGYSTGSVKTIMDGIIGLTDVYTKENYPELNRRERKKREATRLGQTNYLVQSVKYADLTDNTKSIVSGDPGFARVYVGEMIDLLDQMRIGNIHLLIASCHELSLALNQIDAR